jgi:plastocyanin
MPLKRLLGRQAARERAAIHHPRWRMATRIAPRLVRAHFLLGFGPQPLVAEPCLSREMPMRVPRSFRVAAAVIAPLILSLACGDPVAPAAAPDVAIIPGAVAQGAAGFTPNPLVRTGAQGARVTWLNQDFRISALGANLTGHRLISDEGLFDSGVVPPGQAFSFDFPEPGTYRYHCLNHPTMAGSVTIEP